IRARDAAGRHELAEGEGRGFGGDGCPKGEQARIGPAPAEAIRSQEVAVHVHARGERLPGALASQTEPPERGSGSRAISPAAKASILASKSGREPSLAMRSSRPYKGRVAGSSRTTSKSAATRFCVSSRSHF